MKLDTRASGGRRRHRESTSRPMSATGENQPFDPFYMLGMRRDAGLEVSYGYLLVPSRSSVVGMGSKVRKLFVYIKESHEGWKTDEFLKKYVTNLQKNAIF